MNQQKCFSGSNIWTPAWQDKMNKKGRKASRQVIQEYPQFNLIEQPHENRGYDVILRNYDIYIEVKQRDCKVVDITKAQTEKSDIISMYDEHWNGYHCLTSLYLEYAKKAYGSKYKKMSKTQFKKIATTNLCELVEPLISVREKRQTLDKWFL